MGSGQPDKTLASYVYVQDPATWDKTMARLADLFHTPDGQKICLRYKEVGQRLYQISGCAGCHSVDGKENTGPTWQGLYKRPEKMSDGSTLPVVHPDLDASGQIQERRGTGSQSTRFGMTISMNQFCSPAPKSSLIRPTAIPSPTPCRPRTLQILMAAM